MNVNFTGIYENAIFEDLQSLQTGLSSLSDTLSNVVKGFPFQYENLTSFSILSSDHDANKMTTNSYLNIIIMILIIQPQI
jgi:hypothetical protein